MPRKYTNRDQVLTELPGTLPGYIYKTTTLSAALNATATEFTVGTAGGFLGNRAAIDLLIDDEYLYVTGTTGTSFTGVSRGAWTTTAGTHANGATVYNAFIDRKVDKMTEYINTMLAQKYQVFPGYSATGSCPETIEQICRLLTAYECLVDMGILRNVADGKSIATLRREEAEQMLLRLSLGKVRLPSQSGTVSLVFGTSNTGTLPLETDEAFLSHASILPETVVVTDAGTTYVNGEDYKVDWDEARQKWVLTRFDDGEIRDAGTATYEYSWLKGYEGKTPINRERGRVTNRGLILRP